MTVPNPGDAVEALARKVAVLREDLAEVNAAWDTASTGLTGVTAHPDDLLRQGCPLVSAGSGPGITRLAADLDRWSEQLEQLAARVSTRLTGTAEAILQLRDRRDGSYMEEFKTSFTRPGYTMATTDSRARASARGRAHAELHHRCYAELYPDVPPIHPDPPVDGAHAGLVDHKVRRPRGFVRLPDWRLLVALTQLERDHRCPWREHVTRGYTNSLDPVPAEVDAIPDGLNVYAAQRAAGRSAAALDRLRKAELVQVVDLPNLDRFPQSNAAVPFVVLTDAGRAHVAGHAAEYARLYPEIQQSPPAEGDHAIHQ